MTLPTRILEALDNLKAALEEQPAPATETTGWYRPTNAQAEAFAAAHGLTVQQVYGDDQTKITPAPVYNEAEFKSRTSFGYASSGVRQVWTVRDLQLARDLSEQIERAPDATALNELVENAAAPGVVTDAVIAATMLNQVNFDPASFQPRIYKIPGPDGMFPAQTLEQVADYMLQINPIIPPGA